MRKSIVLCSTCWMPW